jgi:hypothetical protein
MEMNKMANAQNILNLVTVEAGLVKFVMHTPRTSEKGEGKVVPVLKYHAMMT